MTPLQLANTLNAELVSVGNDLPDNPPVYAGDFLSRVISAAPVECIWLTIMQNINVAGAAVMADIGAIVLCENVQPDPLLIKKCLDEGITLIKTPLTVYECCKKL